MPAVSRTVDGPKQRQHQVGTGATPHAQGLAEVGFLTRQAGFGRHVEQATDTEGGVDGHAHEGRDTLFDTALQQLVDGRPDIADVAEEVAHAMLDRGRHHGVVGLGGRLQGDLVDRVVEAEHGAVEAFQRIIRIVGGAGAARQGGGGQGEGARRPA
jgi:hypothetical protein